MLKLEVYFFTAIKNSLLGNKKLLFVEGVLCIGKHFLILKPFLFLSIKTLITNVGPLNKGLFMTL